MTKVLVTGSRKWKDRRHIRTILDAFPRDSIIIDGAAPGADTIAHDLAEEMGFVHRVRFPARWNVYGKQAGPIRNRLMFNTTQPDVVIAFPDKDSSGTIDMMKYAASQGCAVHNWGYTGWELSA